MSCCIVDVVFINSYLVNNSKIEGFFSRHETIPLHTCLCTKDFKIDVGHKAVDRNGYIGTIQVHALQIHASTSAGDISTAQIQALGI